MRKTLDAFDSHRIEAANALSQHLVAVTVDHFRLHGSNDILIAAAAFAMALRKLRDTADTQFIHAVNVIVQDFDSEK